MDKKPTIIPIAAGKGGVGKTLLTANLAIALAELGHKTIAIDMDLGGSNLHSFLGLSNQYPGIGDFLKARSAELHELLVQTPFKGLQFLPGDGRTPFMANIPHAQKTRLINHIRKLPAEYLMLDLSAGTSYNTIDFFRLSSQGIMVITPEYPSIMSMLAFLKRFMLRAIERALIKNREIRELLRSDHYKQPMSDGQVSIEDLRADIAGLDPDAGVKIRELCREFRPHLVFNMGEDPDEIMISDQINKSLTNLLDINADYFGYIANDPSVKESIKQRTVFLPSYRQSRAARDVAKIAERITRFWNRPIEDSAQLLLQNTKKLYENRTE